MSDETSRKSPSRSSELPELPELEELPELPELEELPELPSETDELPELPDLPEPPAESEPPQPAPPKPVPAKPVATPKPKATPEPKAAPEPVASAPAVPAPVETAEKPPVAELEPLKEEAGGETAAPAPAPEAAAAAAPGSSGERPPLRVLDKAPLHLRRAALIVAAGCLLPWLGHGGGILTSVVAKLVVLAGAWLWLKQIDHNWGPPLTGFLGKLATLVLKPEPKKKDEGKKPRRRPAEAPTALAHPFPTALHVLSIVLVLVGCVVVPSQDEGADGLRAMAELGMLAWAAYTYVHIHSYERWGRFSPLFPLMFLGMLVGGIGRALLGLSEGLSDTSGLFSVAGGLVVAAGGGLAAYTIVEAMVEAKKEGDRKKAEQIEARKKARAARRRS